MQVKLVMMNTFARFLFTGALLVLAGCYGQPKQLTAKDSQRDGMTTVVTTVTIEGAPEAVFDLVTTARFWPQWHPATRAVGGVTERPFRLGDRIYEAGRIGEQAFQTSWKVVEHARPSRIVLQSETSPTRIAYSFQPRDGGTVFTRELAYKVGNFAAVAAVPGGAEALMRSQSEQAVKQLKAMVEKILREEATGIR
jgi:uncharacterized protein YndB with AHSA1/START domain